MNRLSGGSEITFNNRNISVNNDNINDNSNSLYKNSFVDNIYDNSSLLSSEIEPSQFEDFNTQVKQDLLNSSEVNYNKQDLEALL